MSATSLMALGTKSVFAAYAQLQTTGNNIANASTPGYSRQSVQLATADSAYTGSGYLGRGVTVSTVARASNMFLTQQVVATGATAAADGVRRDMLSQLEKVFVGGQAGLGHASTQIFNAFADVAAAPNELAARQAVLGRLEDFASLSRSSSDQIEALQANLAHDVSGAVSEVNVMAASLAQLNLVIAKSVNGGHMPNDLLDQRDQLIQKMGEKLQVYSYLGPDETANVFVGSGQTLVLGGVANKLLAPDDAENPTRIGLAINLGGLVSSLPTETVGDGLIGGLLRFQDQDLAEARNRLGQLVAGLAGAVNQQQGFGLDLAGNPGTPLYSFGGPQALPAAGNAVDGAGAPLASITLTVADASLLKASDYRLVPDANSPGQYSVTRLSDGWVFQPVADGQTIDGVTITVGAAPPQPGDSFLLRTVGGAASNLTVLLKNPRGLAAANPVTAVVGLANTGTATVKALDIVAAPAGSYQPFNIQFTDNNGGYELIDANTGSLLDAGVFAAGQTILHNGIALTLAGLPKQGDALAITPTTHPAASNGNAVRFDNLASLALIDGRSTADAYADALSQVGVRAQGAMAAADTSATVFTRAKAELTGEVGVNLDEEAAMLIQFQQSYQASAKILQTAQVLFDTILGLAR